MAVLFVDVENCTRLCEDLPPREMNRVLERYFSEFLDIVRGAGGEITEILGDGLVVLFEGYGPKGNVTRALVTACQVQRAAGELNRVESRRHDPIVVNLGLNAGQALVGLTRLRGRLGTRSVYAATGTVANVAARLCALARRGQILTPAEVARTLPRECRSRRLGRRKLKNVTIPVEVFEIRPSGPLLRGVACG